MMDTRPSAIASFKVRIAEHPWRTLGGVFLVGAWFGLEPMHVPRNAVARAAFAMLGSFALRVVRDAALGGLVSHATTGSRLSNPAR